MGLRGPEEETAEEVDSGSANCLLDTSPDRALLSSIEPGAHIMITHFTEEDTEAQRNDLAQGHVTSKWRVGIQTQNPESLTSQPVPIHRA